MLMKIVSIKDLAAQAFMQPGFVHSTGGAVREFSDMVNKEGEAVAKHPDDYEMYYLGEFDDNTGQFSAPPLPELLAQAKNLVIKS